MNAALARTRSASASASVAKHRRRRVETRARRSAIENDDADVRVVLEEDASVTRRKAIMVTTSALAAMVMTPRANRSSYESNEYAFAAESTIDNKMTMYTDDILKFSLSYPTDSWELLVGETGGSGDRSGSRQVIAFAPTATSTYPFFCMSLTSFWSAPRAWPSHQHCSGRSVSCVERTSM